MLKIVEDLGESKLGPNHQIGTRWKYELRMTTRSLQLENLLGALWLFHV